MLRRLSILLFCVCLVWVPAASAQQPTPSDDQVNAIAKKLYCPVCENTPLDVCPTQACIQWRATIKEKLEAGWTEQQILDYFVTQYGERVLAQPSARGLNLFVWVLPPVIVLAGLAIYVFYVHRLTASPLAPVSPSTSNSATSDPYIERLERELEESKE